MAINAEWLWTPNDGRVDGQKVRVREPAKEAYQSELAFYAKLVEDKQVDILALSEIENELVANDLATLLGPNWQVLFRQGRDTATGQDVALLSRLAFMPDTETDFGFPEGKLPGERKGKRLSKVLGARFALVETEHSQSASGSVQVVTAHLLSKRNASRKKNLNRLRQGHALASILPDEGAVILLGDLNDHLGSPTLNVLMRQGKLLSIDRECPDARPDNSEHIDHILFRELRCRYSERISLKPFSDHPAVFAEFHYK